MKTARSLLVLACAFAMGCATAVEDTGTPTLHDAGHGGDTSHATDGDEETSIASDSGGARDSTTTSSDTGSTSVDSSGTDSSSIEDSAIEFDSGTTTDSGSTIDTSPPPTDATTGGCSKDSDCTFPYNCCDLSKHKCSIFIGPICVPA